MSIAREIFYTFSFVYFFVLILVTKLIHKKNVHITKKRVLYRTDRIGDYFIGKKIEKKDDLKVYRDLISSADIKIDIIKFYLNPIYTLKICKEIYTNST